ncbi:MAG TPA: hypothetical protein VJ984_01765 [Xanthomonadales bacterium]|nr:hypothetical protein [Xanthomonadales bacterium]
MSIICNSKTIAASIIRFSRVSGIGLALLAASSQPVIAADQPTIASAIDGLEMRSIGPALMGGRISDIDVHPTNSSTWYVAVGSGGVWKTTNAGVTFTPVFDNQGVYSIGDVTIDPNNGDVVWVGTGENVSGRHVAWGDGVYKSVDGGKNWTNTGLNTSEHIGNILVDPRDSNVVYVAAEGPLWNAGGDRGVYKTTDGGQSWEAVLQVDEDTGITDIEFNPANPDVIYAAAYQRRRHIWGFMAGGPNSGIYKSTDAGETWSRKSAGLPKGDMGKIGLAVTAADPSLVYATIEADDDEKGFYRSADQGESWTRQNPYISGGTGPHYYQELVASPQTADLVYQMDVFLHVTRDGGKTIDYLGTGREKHSDNHAFWIDPEDDFHMIVGSDAGLYESFDQGTTWRHFPNLPVSQFYKVAADNSEPFYNILGGTQDLGTLFGPSRTMITEGVRNQDWYVPLGADGAGVAFDPVDENISYMEYQEGVLFRHHKDSDELVFIQPKPAPGDAPERWNWDAPIVISPHDASRIYFASQRVWRSDDRGNSWQAISGDLTTGQNRYELEYMDRVWSVDDLHDYYAMSQYATIPALSESPVTEGVLYTGSDDGLIHVTSDGGGSWQQAGDLPGVPERSYINDIEASLFNADTVFAIADAHKTGDYSPYVFVSTNRGRGWSSIAGDLPDGTIAWAIQQDHENPNLLFLGAEYGVYVSLNGGTNWHMLAGAPPIAFRDIKLQRRDNDLVGATFGRGIYILDDYSALRTMANEGFGDSATLFPVRDAWWYIPTEPMQAIGMPTLGSDSFKTPNPDFGATFTYFIDEKLTTAKEKRHAQEKSIRNEAGDIPFPGWDRLTGESLESKPRIMILVRDSEDQPVRWLEANNEEGTHRLSWDLRFAAPDAIDLSEPGFSPPWATAPLGPLAAPGRYSAQLFAIAAGNARPLGDAQEFNVKPVRAAAGDSDYQEIASFQREVADLQRKIANASEEIGRTKELLRHMKAAAVSASGASLSLFTDLDSFEQKLTRLETRLSGDPVRQALYESRSPAISARAANAAMSFSTTHAATATQQSDFEIASKDFAAFKADLESLLTTDLEALEADLTDAGAPSWR